uniref:Transmembrane 9 superfamily member n=2 Tax=Kalanchoe fedtschenkoi TaxID=63787 RepID=A0A7N0V454_KALFE
MTSTTTQIPLSYYSLPHCRPERIVETPQNLAQVLQGDYSQNSLYKFKMLESERCKVVCQVKLDAKSAMEFKEKIEQGYYVNMILDDLPVVVPIITHDEESSYIYKLGFKVGLIGHYVGVPEKSHFIYNHLSFTVKYNRDIHPNSTNIVGFEVKAFSVHHREAKWGGRTGLIACELNEQVLHLSGPQEVKEDEEIIFTYNVKFQESDVKWASRDPYLVQNNEHVYWFPILRSLVVIIVLAFKLGKFMLGTLRSDSKLETPDQTREETGGTSVNKDVCSPMRSPSLFCVCIGTGVQVFGMVLGTLILAGLGFLTPLIRGRLVTTMFLLWVFAGLFAGYTSIWLHKAIQGSAASWTIISLRTAVAIPAAVFVIFSAQSTLLGLEKSPAAIPVWTMVKLFIFGSATLIPPVILGGYIGFKKTEPEKPPNPTSELPRVMPGQPLFKHPVLVALVGGIFPYVAVEAEVFNFLSSILHHQFYSSYGFLLLAFFFLAITCSLTTILICYNRLSNDNRSWWWRAFLPAGSSTIIFILFAIYFVLVKLQVTKPVSVALCLGYILIAASAYFLLTGTVGFLACFWFSRLINSTFKTD